MQGSITHIEIGSVTGQKTSKFFSNLFEWDFDNMGEGNGVLATPTCNAGLHPNDPKPGIVVYFAVDDIESSAKRVRELGGEAGTISPEEPGFGRFCPCKDPEGVVFGLHQSSGRASAA
jgi:uncharacterized protein